MRKNHEAEMEEGRDRKEGKEEGKKERQRGCSDSVCLLAVKPKQCRSKWRVLATTAHPFQTSTASLPERTFASEPRRRKFPS